MLYLKYTPVRPLSAFVEYFWLLQDTRAPTREHILPTGTLELVINLHEDDICVYDESGRRHLPGLVVSGVFPRPLVVDTATHALVMGAHFRPGAASPFLSIAPGELCGHGDVLRVPSPGTLREQLMTAPSHEERFRRLEQHLLPYAAVPHDPLVQYAVDCFVRGGTPVRAVVAELGVSHRHFVSRFRQCVGTTPKVFARIQRFQRTLSLVDSAPDWAQLARTCGYSDQAHLIREFSALAGCTPREYLRGRSPLLKDHHLMAR